MNKNLLTVWHIFNPNDPDNEEDMFYRWTFEFKDLFITSVLCYKFEGFCRRWGLNWILNHGYGVPKIKYDSRSNTEFIA